VPPHRAVANNDSGLKSLPSLLGISIACKSYGGGMPVSRIQGCRSLCWVKLLKQGASTLSKRTVKYRSFGSRIQGSER
jgi:hypothetical protein